MSMFIRIRINWIDHLETLKIQVYEAQVEVRPYDLSALNFTCAIEDLFVYGLLFRNNSPIKITI